MAPERCSMDATTARLLPSIPNTLPEHPIRSHSRALHWVCASASAQTARSVILRQAGHPDCTTPTSNTPAGLAAATADAGWRCRRHSLQRSTGLQNGGIEKRVVWFRSLLRGSDAVMGSVPCRLHRRGRHHTKPPRLLGLNHPNDTSVRATSRGPQLKRGWAGAWLKSGWEGSTRETSRLVSGQGTLSGTTSRSGASLSEPPASLLPGGGLGPYAGTDACGV